MVRNIESWRRESAQAVIVRLGCGHQRHVRHRPPLDMHPWVPDDAGCAARVGEPIECVACARRQLPQEAATYRRTPDFDETTVPAGLRADHRTRGGTWARVQVGSGELAIAFDPPLSVQVVGRPGEPVIIPPQLLHRVLLRGPVRFAVEFLRVPALPG